MKRVFLTGASSGIGLAVAQALLESGHEVWGTSRDPSRLPDHERFHPVRLDLREPASIETAFAESLGQAGYFDVVINNAGSGHFGPAERLSGSEMADQFQVLLFAHVRLMQLALAAMQPRRSGLIINVTSLAARLPVPFMAAYNAAKAAMASFTMSTQLETSGSGVRIVDLQPADIRTSFNDTVVKGAEDQAYAPKVAKTWQLVEKNMAEAPGPEIVGRAVLLLLAADNPPPRITVGGFFQGRIAPVIYRLLPQRVRIWGLKKYYQLPS
jgi:NAD(P)-dependent dehydrogenase (short-subunit alcohol dehydrogenase family)